jgi:hypothetical protein
MAGPTEYMADVSNRGRWGPGDELGALNLVTDRAEASIRRRALWFCERKVHG